MPLGYQAHVRSLFVVCTLYATLNVYGQNLVPNPSFETFDVCPAGLSGGPLNCIPWVNPTQGTSDYFNECSTGAPDVPDNTFGYQDAHTGVAYGGGYYYAGGILFDYREYLQVRLTEPLIAGTTYDVSLWYSLADDFGCPMNQLGIYISVIAPLEPSNNSVLNYTPQIQHTSGLISNTTTWEQLNACYVATGGEEYITIGNYYTDAETEADPLCANGGFSYLFIDDVSVVLNGEPPGSIDVDLGDDAEVCDSVIIDPGLGNMNYIWSDGSHDPTLTVTMTGTYYLTVTSGCDFGYDSIEVTIIESAPPVDLGPDLLICPGDQILITLDDDLGEYTWQDNSTGAFYLVTGPGIYAVTLDDGCSTSADEVEVLETIPPESISLGNDTILCDGESLSLSFNSGLGDFVWQDGTMDPEYEITMPGTYAVTLSNMCGSVDDDIVVDFLPDPILTFPDDVIIACPGDVVLLEFDPALGNFLWQDGTTESSYEVTEEGEYSVSVINMCGSDFDETFVDFLEEPILDLGNDLIICPSQLPYLLDVSDIENVDDYNWQDGSDDVQYEVQQGGIYAVTVSNACFAVSDEIEIIVEDAAPDIDLPADVSLCPGETLVLDVSDIPGEYEWQDGSTNETYSVTQSGTYAVTVSNPCGTGFDSINVVYEADIPLFDLGTDIDICPGEEVVLQVNIPDVSYLWQDGSTGNTFVVNTSGIIILTLANNCNAIADTLVATINGSPPVLNLQDTIALCQGWNIELDAMLGGVSYAWNTGDTTQIIQVGSSGVYVLTVSNACGSAADSVIVSDAGTAPSVNLGSDITICSGESVSIDANAINGSILWHDGSSGNTFIASGSGLISVQVSNSCGIAFDTLEVSVHNPTPLITLGADTTLCPEATLLLNPGVQNVDYLWQDGSMDTAYFVNEPLTVFVHITDVCGSSTDTMVIDYYPAAPSFSLGPDASLCPGESILLSPGISGVSYLWQDGSMSSNYTATQPGVIYVTLQSNCWQISDTLEIFEDTAGPMVELGNDTTVCEGQSVLIESGILGVDYLWHDGSTASDFLVTSTEQVILQVQNACGSDADTIVVIVDGSAPEIDLGQDTVLCEGTSFILDPTIIGDAVLLWQDGSSASTVIVDAPGIYHVQGSNTCGIDADTLYIEGRNQPFSFLLGNDTLLCADESLTLQAPATNDVLLWSNGSTDQSIVVSSGVIWLSITNLCGMTSDTISIETDTNMPDVSIEPFYQICEGESVILDITQPFSAQYLWNTGITIPMLSINTPGTFTATISTDCETLITSAEIQTEDCNDPVLLFIPNIFSPNGDNINDVFMPQTNLPEFIGDYELTVFDRWGDIVFRSEDLHVGWQGMFNNKLLNPGVFIYTIRYRNLSLPAGIENVFFEYGDVTLIR